MRTVLVADPNATFSVVVADALQRLGGFQVVTAATGPEALQKAQAARPMLAVIDGALPECRLPDLILQLRQQTPNLPVVFMPVEAGDVPADIPVQGVMTKPFFLPDLPALIINLLGPEPGPPAQAEAARPRNTRLAVTGALNAAPLRARLGQTGILPPAPPPKPVTLDDETRRQVEGQMEALSRVLRDEPAFLAQDEKVLVIVPRLSQSATTALVQVAARAWAAQTRAPEVIRFEGESEITRYMLYSARVVEGLTLSVALRLRIPLPIVRRVVRDTAARLGELVQPAPADGHTF